MKKTYTYAILLAMQEDLAFVDVKSLSVAYADKSNVLAKLAGRKQSTHSVLRDVRFQLDQGVWATLFGAPASGKTTLLRVLAGAVAAERGQVRINGKRPSEIGQLAAGYVSVEESEPLKDTVNEALYAYGKTHRIENLPARIGEISETLELNPLLYRDSAKLSITERLRVNLAKAALSDSPLILLDDVADQLGPAMLKAILPNLFYNRTVIIATRFPATAELLDVPVLLLHSGTLAHFGTRDEIANGIGTPRVLDVWLEGLRYDLFRTLKKHPGVLEARLLPDGRFHGQRIRITLQSSRYLPTTYDLISQAPLIRVEELPVSLTDILERL